MNDIVPFRKDILLTNIAIQYPQDAFIANRIAPVIMVDEEEGEYFVWNKYDAFTVEKDLWALRARANEVNFSTEIASFGPLTRRGLENPLTEKDVKILGLEGARRKATENVRGKILLRHELEVRNVLGDTSIFDQTETLSGTAQFNDYSNSDPLAKIQLAIDTVTDTGLATGNRLVAFMGEPVWRALRNHPDLLARLGANNVQNPLNEAQLASLLGLDEIIVSRAKYNVAKEGQSESLQYIWGKDLWIGLLTANPAADAVNPLYTFRLKNYFGVDRYTEASTETEYVRCRDKFDEKVVASDLVFYYKNAVG